MTEYGNASPCVTLRKMVRLNEIDEIVNNCQKKSDSILKNAENR
jgi:hypothetical protein